MLVKLQGYKARDDNSPSAFRSLGRQKLRASDIISLISVATKLADIIAGFWSGMLAVRFAHIVWERVREERPYDEGKVDKIIRWTTQYYFPPTTMRGPQTMHSPQTIWGRLFSLRSVVIRLSLLIFGLSFIGAPLVEGALDWSSSSQLGEPGTRRTETGNPTAQFFRWNFPLVNNKVDRQEISEAASLASIAWARQTTDGEAEDADPSRSPCRHVTNDTPFPVGSEIHNVTIPCIQVHDISWPTEPMSAYAKKIVQNSNMTSASDYAPFGASGDHPGIAVLFDPTNETLPLPVRFGNYDRKKIFYVSGQPDYPSPFLWSGTMTVIVLLARSYPFEPSLVDPFGYNATNKPLNNHEESGTVVDLTPGNAGVRSDRTYTYLRVNMTAGLRFSSRGVYVKSNVIETDGHDDDANITAGPWVREALYMMSDVMSTIAVMNSSEVATWDNLLNYTESLIRHSYLGAWDVLQRRFDPNSTELAVTLRESRLQASVNKPRVVGWFFLNIVFTCTALSLPLIFWDDKDNTGEMQDIADLMRKVIKYEENLKDEDKKHWQKKDVESEDEEEGTALQSNLHRSTPNIDR
ncbi:hypothetical protein OQA88_13509 [Cercophora sp. LCS_1]